MSQPGPFWTVALRRQPVRIVGGEPEGGYTDAYELICCDCGDNPELDYLDVAPEVQLVRGPYPLPAGVTAYVRHVQRYHAGLPEQAPIAGQAANEGAAALGS